MEPHLSQVSQSDDQVSQRLLTCKPYALNMFLWNYFIFLQRESGLQSHQCGRHSKRIRRCHKRESLCDARGTSDDLHLSAGYCRGEGEEQWCVLCSEAMLKSDWGATRADGRRKDSHSLDEWSTWCVHTFYIQFLPGEWLIGWRMAK